MINIKAMFKRVYHDRPTPSPLSRTILLAFLRRISRFYIRDALPFWTYLYASSILFIQYKDGTKCQRNKLTLLCVFSIRRAHYAFRRIIIGCASQLKRRQRTEQSSSRRIMHRVLVFIVKTDNLTNNTYLRKFVHSASQV